MKDKLQVYVQQTNNELVPVLDVYVLGFKVYVPVSAN